jgi:uncharacterized Zn finger protein
MGMTKQISLKCPQCKELEFRDVKFKKLFTGLILYECNKCSAVYVFEVVFCEEVMIYKVLK